MPVGELNFAVPTLFGLEGLCADEIRRLGLPSVRRKMAGCCVLEQRGTCPG